MTRSRFLFFLASTAIVLPILAGSLLGAAVDDQPAEDSLYKYLSVFTDSLGLVHQAYVEETDVDTLMAAALDGVTDGLDPMAVYVPSDAVSDYLQARQVGASRSGVVLMRERGMVYVMAVLPDSPAEAAGLGRVTSWRRSRGRRPGSCPCGRSRRSWPATRGPRSTSTWCAMPRPGTRT